ncbi:unnamed protein product [Effrenium voratum]|uniref:Uncharacterized protein n=1 Tax=Effrenium voratum TaxID=2562239 RepID=A0AA36HTT9_9DINO|nr:unnamed protein product [Effrenium voratum]
MLAGELTQARGKEFEAVAKERWLFERLVLFVEPGMPGGGCRACGRSFWTWRSSVRQAISRTCEPAVLPRMLLFFFWLLSAGDQGFRGTHTQSLVRKWKINRWTGSETSHHPDKFGMFPHTIQHLHFA